MGKMCRIVCMPGKLKSNNKIRAKAYSIKMMGLADALRSEIHKYGASGLFTLRTNYTGIVKSLDLQREVLIFRIVQEAFTNIIKHSMAKVVNFEMSYHDNFLTILIIDDVIGFNEVIIKQQHAGAGLNNIKVRTHMLNGHVEI